MACHRFDEFQPQRVHDGPQLGDTEVGDVLFDDGGILLPGRCVCDQSADSCRRLYPSRWIRFTCSLVLVGEPLQFGTKVVGDEPASGLQLAGAGEQVTMDHGKASTASDELDHAVNVDLHYDAGTAVRVVMGDAVGLVLRVEASPGIGDHLRHLVRVEAVEMQLSDSSFGLVELGVHTGYCVAPPLAGDLC